MGDPAALTLVVVNITNASSGQPIPGSTVLVQFMFGACPFTEGYPPDTVIADQTGRYRARVGLLGRGFSGCVKVVATPPQGSSLVADSAMRAHVSFGTNTSDSVEIDVALRPAA